ncbi:hypothetical protein [Dactylosporangium salmoneum]|uniref:hypothetical protein n=1 Tax=Dactylosporangium salmoneum TaxID=53361 RepID=UPI0031D27BAD
MNARKYPLRTASIARSLGSRPGRGPWISAVAGPATSRVAATQFDAAPTRTGDASSGGGQRGTGPAVPLRLRVASDCATVAGQDGAPRSSSSVRWAAAGGARASAPATAGQTDAAATRAVSPFPPRADGCTRPVGVRDASSGRLRRHVDGALTADVAAGPAWAAGGAFTIGRGEWHGGDAGHFPGRIDRSRSPN